MKSNSIYIGLPYAWGGRDPETGLDCLTAMDCARTSVGLPGIDLSLPRLVSVYDDYQSEDELPASFVFDLATELLDQTDWPGDYDMALLRSGEGRFCCGLKLPGGKIGYITPAGGRIMPAHQLTGILQGFYCLNNILVSP